MNKDREALEDVVREEVDMARKRFREARARFPDTMQAISTGLQSSDGVLHISQPSQAERDARAVLESALKRFNDLLLRGIVPETIQIAGPGQKRP